MSNVKKFSLLSLSILLLIGATSCSAITGRLATAFLANQEKRQVAAQWDDEHFELKRPLDFGPFESALATFGPRAAELETQLATATIPDMQAMMAAGTLTAEELTLFYLNRIRTYDGTYNTVIELNPEALEIARALDAERATGTVRSQLHGMPILLKDNIGTGDQMHNTSGAAALADARAGRDSFVAAQLRQAGAIFLGKNNLSEWANFMSTQSTNGFSALGGPTRNAYGRYDVLGSSSGTASSISLNFAAAGVGSETIGSIVAPSSNNSVVGLRPTLGLVSGDLIIPISHQLDTAGPIARTVTDLAILLGPLATLDPANPFADQAADVHGRDFTAALDTNALQGKRIGLVSLGTENKESLAAIGASLRNAGAEVVEVIVGTGELREVNPVPILAYGIGKDVNEYLAETNAPVKTLADVVAFNNQDLARRAPYGQDYLEQAIATNMTEAEYIERVTSMRAITNGIINRLMDNNNLVALVGVNNAVSPIYAVAGAPGLSVPAGYDVDGRPFGATFFARPGSDETIIGLAYAFEQANNHRRPPQPQQP